MERLRIIHGMINQTQLIVLICIIHSITITTVIAQKKYDIRFLEQSSLVENPQVCFEVQIRSQSNTSWDLAGQNYRLYYDASIATFNTGNSLLENNYQQLKLIQDVQNVDASEVNGSLSFDNNLGFLNYAIELLDPTESGAKIPVNGEWLSTSIICFQGENLIANKEDFSLVWARNGMTESYATSFVEISERTPNNQLETAIGINFFDYNNNYSEEESNQVITQEKLLRIKSRVLLQGAFDIETGLMKDDLRKLNYLPLITPYRESLETKTNTKNAHVEEVIIPDILNTTGEEAITDWIFLELRNRYNPNEVIATRSALLQRNGDIVDLDGKSAVEFLVSIDAYYLAIRHRNHLGIMTLAPINPSNDLIEVDFTDPNTLTYGQYSRKQISRYAIMWGGNADGNSYLIYQGGTFGLPDIDKVFFDIFSDPKNHQNRYNHISKGYSNSDLNMDGEVKYQGRNNEIDELIFFNVFSHPMNIQYYSNFYIEEQLPENK